jgi:hypothetical protein
MSMGWTLPHAQGNCSDGGSGGDSGERNRGGVPIMRDMTKVEATELYRSGGRGAHEARALKLTPGFVATAEGSVLIEVGHTRVLCNATIENGVPGWMRNLGRGWVADA